MSAHPIIAARNDVPSIPCGSWTTLHFRKDGDVGLASRAAVVRNRIERAVRMRGVPGIADVAAGSPDFPALVDEIRRAGTDSLEYFGMAYTHEGGLFLQQNPEEFAALTLLLRERGPFATYVEIGSASGGACLFLHRSIGFGRVLSLDDGQHRRAGSQDAHFGEIADVRRFRGDSHSDAAHEFLEANLDAPIDVAFIDGDHSYEGVKQDVELTLPFCSPGALVIFHDTIACIGVERIWLECVQRRLLEPMAEFIGSERPMGIAVGRVP